MCRLWLNCLVNPCRRFGNLTFNGWNRWSWGPQRAGHSRLWMASNSQLRGKSIGEIFEEVAAWTTNLNVSHPICLKCCACGRGTGVGIDTRRHEVAKSGPKIPYARISHFGADVFQSICIEIGNYFCWFCWVLFTSFPAVCIFLWLIHITSHQKMLERYQILSHKADA